jgi:hypothetical protein
MLTASLAAKETRVAMKELPEYWYELGIVVFVIEVVVLAGAVVIFVRVDVVVNVTFCPRMNL